MKQRLAPALAGLGAFLVLVWPVLDPGVQLFYRDTGRLYYPVKRYIAERLAQGQLPLWDPWTECGTSLLGQMSPGLLHPWTLLYALPFDLAFKLNHLLPLLLAGIGTYLLTRRLGASRAAAVLGGLIYGACGYLVSQASANLIYVVGPAGVPLALERFIALVDEPSRKKLIAAAALLALCAYGGEPQSMLICGLIGASFAIARAISRKQYLLRSLGQTALWGALALALSAPVALPALAHLRRSERAKGLTQRDLTHFAVSPRRLPGLLVSSAFNYTPDLWSSLKEKREPTPFEEYFGTIPFAPSIYLGAGALLLACFALTAGRRGRFFVIGGAILALAATGENLGIEPILRAAVPGFSLFRYAEKLIAFASLLFAVAAALGLDATQKHKRALSIAAATAALAFAGASLGKGPWLQAWLVERGDQHSAAAAAAFVKALTPGLRQEAAVLAVIALAAFLRPGRAIIAATCAVALIIHGRSLLVTLPVRLFHEPPALAQKLFDDAGPSAGRWRLYVHPSSDIDAQGLDPKQAALGILREPLRPHFESLFHIEGAANYFSNDDPNYGALLRSDSAPQIFDLLTIAFFVVMPDQLTAAEAKDLGFVQTDFGLWIQLLPPAPRARLLDQVRVEPDAAAVGEHLHEVDATRVAMLFRRDAVEVVKGKGIGAATIARPSPEEIDVAVDAETASILEVGEHFDPGWSARVDGKPATAIAVDGAILGTAVPAGRHQVTLRFRPAGFLPGLAIALLAVGVSCLRWRRRG